MAVFLVARHRGDQVLVPGDLPVIEVCPQRREAPANPLLVATVVDQVALGFLQDRGRPAHGAQVALGEPDRRIE
jgi:hypothetical protein